LFTTVSICPSFHAGSLIVARYLNRLLLSVSFFFYKRSNTSVQHRSIISKPSTVMRYNRISISRSRHDSLRFTKRLIFNYSPYQKSEKFIYRFCVAPNIEE